jgi:hypothetical protein
MSYVSTCELQEPRAAPHDHEPPRSGDRRPARAIPSNVLETLAAERDPYDRAKWHGKASSQDRREV